MSEKTITKKVNGLDINQLFETIEALKCTPNLGDFRFRLQNRWIDGGHNRSSIKNFYGAGQDQQRTEPFVLDADEPPILLGNDSAANPVEYLLHAVTACVTTALVAHAAARGVNIEELESRTEGDIDLRGFLGVDDSVPNGFQAIRIKFRIKADVPDETLREVVQLGPTYSPVFDTVTRAVPVDVSLEE
jgi:uncharacterized OsmC-like protein